MAKHTATILVSYDDRSGEVVSTLASDVGDSGWQHRCDMRSTPSKLSSVLALLGIEFLLSVTSEDAGLTSRF